MLAEGYSFYRQDYILEFLIIYYALLIADLYLGFTSTQLSGGVRPDGGSFTILQTSHYRDYDLYIQQNNLLDLTSQLNFLYRQQDLQIQVLPTGDRGNISKVTPRTLRALILLYPRPLDQLISLQYELLKHSNLPLSSEFLLPVYYEFKDASLYHFNNYPLLLFQVLYPNRTLGYPPKDNSQQPVENINDGLMLYAYKVQQRRTYRRRVLQEN